MSERSTVRTKVDASPAPGAPVPAGLIQRRCACGGAAGLSGQCPECDRERLQAAPALIQPKLAVGPPDDEYEREADAVAETVMRMPEPGAAPPARAPEHDDEEEEEIASLRTARNSPASALQRQPAGGQAEPGRAPALSGALLSQIESVRGGGHPLDTQARAFMEPRFGHDFGAVRVHAGPAAAGTARSLQARAYTIGRDIVFGPGEYAPGTIAGRRLIAHELTHVVQQAGNRSPAANQCPISPRMCPLGGVCHVCPLQVQARSIVGQPAVQLSIAPAADEHAPARTGAAFGVAPVGADGVSFAGLEFQPNPMWLRRIVEEQIAKGGSSAAFWLLFQLSSSSANIHSAASPWASSSPTYELIVDLDKRLAVIMPMLGTVIQAVEADRVAFIAQFEAEAIADVGRRLDSSENTARREAVRYGLTTTQTMKTRTYSGMAQSSLTREFAGVPIETPVTTHHVQTGTPTTVGLQEAAEMLLRRQQKIASLEREQRSAVRSEMLPYDPKGIMYVPDEPRFSQLGREIQAKREEYQQTRFVVASEFPILAKVSELDKDTGSLEIIANKGAGSETAAIIGGLISETLMHITTVRANMNKKDSVNIWRLPSIVDETRKQLGGDTDPVKNRWISEQVEHEKPGILDKILLGIMNVAALVLAKPTMGISLVVAAGVNVAVTAGEVEEYFMQKALVGADFDKAKALSQEDPSLFWLAVGIVGTVFDVIGAAKALELFGRLRVLAKAAVTVEAGKEADAIEALVIAARQAGGEKFARRVYESALRKRAEQEIRTMLQSLARASQAEAAETLGRIPVRSIVGEVKLSRTGRLFICTNPCILPRAKYEATLAKHPNLEKKLGELEKEAEEAATLAKQGHPDAETTIKAVKDKTVAIQSEIVEAQAHLLMGPQLYSKLSAIGLDSAAVDRILAKGLDIGNIKGRLFDELLAIKGRKLMAQGQAGREALAGRALSKEVSAKAQFWPGSQVTDRLGEELTDGILGYLEGDTLYILTVFEAKAGQRSATALRILEERMARMADKDIAEIRRFAGDAFKDMAAKAKAAGQKLHITVDDIVDEVKRYPSQKQIGGQVRETIERLSVMSDLKTGVDIPTVIKLNGEEVKVIGFSPTRTKITGVLPKDVKEQGIRKALAKPIKEGGPGIHNFDVLKLDIEQDDVQVLAEEIREAAAKVMKPVP